LLRRLWPLSLSARDDKPDWLPHLSRLMRLSQARRNTALSSWLKQQMPQWLKSGHVRRNKASPLYPQERTFAVQRPMTLVQ
jgi:hypothetical protein